MDSLHAAYRRRRTRELKELAIALSYSQHAPDKINEALTDESELQDQAQSLGLDTDVEQYWE